MQTDLCMLPGKVLYIRYDCIARAAMKMYVCVGLHTTELCSLQGDQFYFHFAIALEFTMTVLCIQQYSILFYFTDQTSGYGDGTLRNQPCLASFWDGNDTLQHHNTFTLSLHLVPFCNYAHHKTSTYTLDYAHLLNAMLSRN